MFREGPVPGVSAEEYRGRRRRLMGAMEAGSVALLPSARVRYRNRDAEYPFRQDSDFYYLTGFEEPDCILVLAPGRPQGETVLFCRDRDARAERYTGERLGPERAAQVLGLDDAFPYADLDDILPGIVEGRERVHVTLGDHPDFDRRLIGWVTDLRAKEASGASPPGEFVSLKSLLHEQRLYKSPAERGLMERAAEITARAHFRAMRRCAPGVTEGQLEAELAHEFLASGARAPAYPPIVAGGRNACVMHYMRNDGVLHDGDLVLIDAGCEFEHYAADVTRTFPVNGTFTPPQRDLYELVLAAQMAALDAAVAGADFLAPHREATRVLTGGLIDLGLLGTSFEEAIETEAYRQYTVHNSSHWLGIDVHDVGDYRVGGAWRTLEPGMAITVEPGLYFPDDGSVANVPAHWRGVGIRIEDDVLIEERGSRVLTAPVPRLVDDIEAVMRG
ncbi:MAG: aminopeptidase P N-terminal domain-containing protein [Gammaproteobacteria bacterium]|nr:aminopeptidase P N-terminal domain-containing protein [Gammaproteobacteria bacterium]